MTRAAERLQMAQPALTRIIHGLEKELEVSLFDRSNKRRLVLTPAGQTFLKRIAPLLEQYEEAVQATRQVARGKLLVGYAPTAMLSGVLPKVLQVYERTAREDLILRDLATQSYHTQVKALKEHRLDAVCTLKSFDEPGIGSECVGRASMVVTLPVAHRLAHLDAIPLAALADEAWIWLPRQMFPCVHDDILQICRQAGFEPRIAQEVQQAQGLPSLVAGGGCIALMSEWGQRSFQQQGVTYRPLLDAPYQVELHVLWRQDDCFPLLQTFLQVVREISIK